MPRLLPPSPAAAGLLLALLGSSPSSAPSRPQGQPGSTPNVLIVVADDLGVDPLRFYGVGGSVATTPVLDQIAARGVVFENAWATPVCSPSRMVLQTGRLPFRTGIGGLIDPDGFGLQESEWTLPEMVDAGTDATYRHAAFGKWALKNAEQGGLLAPNVAGWGHFAGTLELPTYYVWNKVVNGVESLSNNYVTTDTVNEALAWAASVDEPWLMYVAFNAPHAPFHAPPPALHTQNLAVEAGPEVDPEPYYLAMVESLDTELGRLLEGLDPDLQETVLIFVGDNGTPGEVVSAPFEAAKAKTTLYQGGVRVPLIVSGPVTPTAGRSDALVGIADVFATVADLVGVDLEQTLPDVELDSISLLPYLLDPDEPSQRKILQSEVFLPNGYGTPVIARRTARSARYKLIQRWNEDELYDLELDPLENDDLLLGSLDAEQAAAYAELSAAIEDLRGFLGASVHSYGCPQDTPFDTLFALESEPQLGQTLTLFVDNTLGTQSPGAASVLLWNTAPDPAFPCGELVPGWGMDGGPGELLISTAALPPSIAGPLWSGTEPAAAAFPLPVSPALVDSKLYVQGVLLDSSPSAAVPVALTNALALQLGP